MFEISFSDSSDTKYQVVHCRILPTLDPMFKIAVCAYLFFLNIAITVIVSNIATIRGRIKSHHKSSPLLASFNSGFNVVTREVGVFVTSKHVLLESVLCLFLVFS